LNVNCSFNVHQLMVNWSKTAATCRHSINFPNCMVSNQNSYCLFSQLSNPKFLWFHQNIIKMYFTETSGDWQAFQQKKIHFSIVKKTKEITRNVNHKKQSVHNRMSKKEQVSLVTMLYVCIINQLFFISAQSISFKWDYWCYFMIFLSFFRHFVTQPNAIHFFYRLCLNNTFYYFLPCDSSGIFLISNTTGNKRKI